MKIAFLILVVLHGLLHTLGFVKAFDISELNLLTQNISRPFGILWLSACVLLVIAAAMLAFENGKWMWLGLIGILISQTLIIYFWQDAKFGTVANVIIFFGIVAEFASSGYYRRYQRDVRTGLQQKAYFENSDLTETDVASLPGPVKKYMRYSGSVGKRKVNNFNIEFTGKIRKDEQSAWMPFTSQQYNFMQTPTRLFFMKAVMKNLPVAGYHSFKDGHAFMDIRLLSLFKVQFQDGPEMDLSETVTFFNDMCCLAPGTLIDKRITWLAVDGNRVKASFTNNHISVSAWLYFSDAGALVNFVSDDRYSADAGRQLPWSTPLKDYQQINGYTLMDNAETIYSYPDRDLCYGTFKLVSVNYNCLSISD